MVMPEVEKIHFETTYQKHRLNEEIDIQSIDIRRLMQLIDDSELKLQPLTTSVIRQMTAPKVDVRFHMDSGANRSVTPHRGLLHDIRQIPPMSMDGVGGKIQVNEVGMMKLLCEDRSYIWARTYFCPDVPETIVSPTDITMSRQNNFTAWSQYCNVVTANGHLNFYTISGIGKACMPIFMRNGLWYSKQTIDDIENWTEQNKPTLRNLTAQAEYELWHQRLGHPGEKIMNSIHVCVDGVPNLYAHKHKFHKCESCMRAKVTAAVKQKTTNLTVNQRGEMFHMDFGFVRGSSYKTTDQKGKIITSRDGYNSYLIIVDAFTRYTWIFLSSSKQPPLTIVKQFLQRFGLKEGTRRQIRCDQGGELARSNKNVKLSSSKVTPLNLLAVTTHPKMELPNVQIGHLET